MRTRSHVAIFIALYGVSGIAGLMYEVAWSRWLSLLLGNTAGGHSLVISTFMGGLGLGYFVGGRVAVRVLNPVLWYAVLEFGIAIWGLTSPLLYGLMSGVFQIEYDGTPAALQGSMWIASALLLAFPTFCMGATFPMALESVKRVSHSTGDPVAQLYGINSAGAALGSIAAGFFLIAWLGLSNTCTVAALLNAIAGLGALALVRTGRARKEKTRSAPEVSPSEFRARPAIVSAGVLGLVAMGVQAIWIRLFAVTLGSSAYAFSTVLAVFIAGISLGSFGLGYVRSRRKVSFSALCLLMVVALWLSGSLVDYLPYVFARFRVFFDQQNIPFELYVLVRFLGVSLVLLPVTVLFGAALPLATGDNGEGTPGVARAFGANTLGAVLGAGLTLPLLVPAWGLEGTYRLGLGCMLALGLFHGWKAAQEKGTKEIIQHVAVGALLLGLVSTLTFDPYVLSAGAFRSKKLPSSQSEFLHKLKKSDLVYYKDGPDASVAVLERNDHRVLKVNGKPDASTRGDMFTQVMSGHLPLILHPEPKESLVIGLGSGVTAHAAWLHGGRVDVVELSRGVIEAASFFSHVNKDVLEQERVRLIEGDARGFLQGQKNAYDVIISEPSNPWMAGNAGLFSVEFFLAAKSALKSGGLLAQWFHTYEMDDETLHLVLNSLGSVFPYVSVWEMFPNDLLLVSSLEPLSYDWKHMESRYSSAQISEDLSTVGILGLPELLSRQAMRADFVRSKVTQQGLRNTDDHPLLEYAAPKSLYEHGRANLLVDWSERRNYPGEGKLVLDQWVREVRPLSLAEVEHLFVLHTVFPGASPLFRRSLMPRILQESDDDFLREVLFTFVRGDELKGQGLLLEMLYRRGKEEARTLYIVALALFQSQNTEFPLALEGESVHSILEKCLALGDEPKGRCEDLWERRNE